MLAAYRFNEEFLGRRADAGFPPCHVEGLNSTPCFERPEIFSRHTDQRAVNPTLAPLTARLHNIVLLYGLHRSALQACDQISVEDEGGAEEEKYITEYAVAHAAFLREASRLLLNG